MSHANGRIITAVAHRDISSLGLFAPYFFENSDMRIKMFEYDGSGAKDGGGGEGARFGGT